MMVLFWRTAAFLSGSWLLLTLLIRAQPYDAAELRNMLNLSEDCARTCLMDFQPGQSTPQEAASILARIADVGLIPEWVEQWGWTGRGREVTTLDLRTNIAWGDFVLAYGWPEPYHLIPGDTRTTSSGRRAFRHEGWYADWSLYIFAAGPCANSSAAYDWTVELRFRAEPPDFPADRARLMTNCR